MSSTKKLPRDGRRAPAVLKAEITTRRASSRGTVLTARKVMTLRLEPSLHERLAVLHKVEKRPINSLVNEAVEQFLDRQNEAMERERGGEMSRIKADRKSESKLRKAIKECAESEGRYAKNDPVEGVVVNDRLGPSQRAVRSILARY